MSEISYTVIVKTDPKGGYWTQVPALSGCGSQGDTMEETLENTREAILSYVGSKRKHGEPVPPDDCVVVKVAVAA